MKYQFTASHLAFAALASSQAASAQEACVAPEDLSDTITYAVPILYEAMKTPCGTEFAANPFMSVEGEAFVERFRVQQDAAWPGTLRLLRVFMTQQSGEGEQDQMIEMVASLPDEALRPIVDMIVAQMVNERLASEIQPTTCADVAEVMELLAPLPPENISNLATFIARQAELDEPSICGGTVTFEGELGEINGQ